MRLQLLVLAICGWGLSAGGQRCAANSTVDLQLADGRELHGSVDVRTDDQTFWLRQESDNIVLVVATPWAAIVSATLDDAPIDVDALRMSRDRLVSSGEQDSFILEPPAAETGSPAQPGVAPFHAPTLGAASPARMRNLEIVNASLLNLDRDVESDGLEVQLAAIGDNGLPMPVRGSISAQLYGEKRAALAAGPVYGVLDRWSQPVAPGDFVDGVATYTLRFRKTAPEQQFDLLPDAVLSVQLGAFGQGDFAASAPVVLRQFSPLRDSRQQMVRSRFFPGELTGRVPPGSTRSPAGLWQFWAR